MIRECATVALTGGNCVKGDVIAVANGVIQAGVVCRDDRETALALSEIAGVRIPKYRRQRRKNRPGKACVHCGEPMVPWTRDPSTVPEGCVMHYARGYCEECREPYRRMLARLDRKPQLRKEIDRKRHHRQGPAKAKG